MSFFYGEISGQQRETDAALQRTLSHPSHHSNPTPKPHLTENPFITVSQTASLQNCTPKGHPFTTVGLLERLQAILAVSPQICRSENAMCPPPWAP